MSTFVEKPAGAIGLTKYPGTIGANLITIGQVLNGSKLHNAMYTHALISVGHGLVVQAQPQGATLDEQIFLDHDILWFFPKDATPTQQLAAADAAVKLVGTPYGWLDYVAIAAHRFHLCWLHRTLDERIVNEHSMICSQLVDEAYYRAGVHLFDDERMPGDVTPADLAAYAEKNGMII